MTRIHDFQTSLTFGKRVEEDLDEIFSKWYLIEEVSLADEKRLGIDRIFTKPDGTKLKIEYKADRWALQTGNVFMELSVNGNPGWTRKTIADVVIYALVDVAGNPVSAIVLKQETIKEMLPKWEQLPLKRIQNTNFFGVGVLVPIESLRNSSKTLTFN